MPPVNIYTSRDRVGSLYDALEGLSKVIAKELSCGNRVLNPKDMSLRVFVPEVSHQIANTELEIKAHAYPERIERQDNICSAVEEYIKQECPAAGTVSVWLQLGELGYSFE